MEEEQLQRIALYKNSCWVAYLHPLTFVVPEDENPWEVKLEDINNVSYNNGNLIRIVTRFKLEETTLDGLICYDGAIAIPRIGKLHYKEDAVNFFNKLFIKLIFSGFQVEGVDRRDVVSGKLYDNYAISTWDFGDSAISNLHTKLRNRQVSNIDSIYLAGPRIIKVNELLNSINIGGKLLEKIPNFTPKFLIKGITEIRYKNWDLVLSNLWITAEQLVDFLWYNIFLSDSSLHPEENIAGRINSFKEDNRTWSASVKQEILFQNKIISSEILSNLYMARKVRNKLVHEGKPVDKQVAMGLFLAVRQLIKVATKQEDILSFEINKIRDDNDKTKLDQSFFEEWIKLPRDNFTEHRFGSNVLKNIKNDSSSNNKPVK
jgi:hypothetical protein